MNRKSSPNQPGARGADDKPGVTRAGGLLTGPRELMLFVDGELDDAQRADIEAKLATDRDARCQVAAMQLTRSLLRERVEQPGTSGGSSAADSIADLVMARIASNDLPQGEIDAAPAPMGRPNGAASGARAARLAPVADREAGSPSPDGARGPRSLPHIGIPPSKRTANDNARTIWALAAVAVAAAAAFMIWGKTEAGPVANPQRPVTTQGVPDPTVEVMGNLPPDAPPTPDTEVAGGVEVATVDFGKAQGSVFYVPGSAGETTTVVWLADEEPGGDK